MADKGNKAQIAQAITRVRNDKVWTSNITTTPLSYAAHRLSAIGTRSQTRDLAHGAQFSGYFFAQVTKKGRKTGPIYHSDADYMFG